jgi:hypothetical protein
VQPDQQRHDEKPVVKPLKHAPAVEIWSSLANAVDAGTITTSDRLAQFVLQLARNEDLTASDVEKFDAAFPKAIGESRILDEKDAETLRGIK